MRRTHFTSLVCLAGLAGGCSDPPQTQGTATASAAVIGGTPSTSSEDYVVAVSVPGGGSCSGTLIAPNVVLTALHCVAEINLSRSFSCNYDGTLVPGDPGGGVMGDPVDPERVQIRVGPEPFQDDPTAYGARIFGTGSTNICQDDFALVVLDRDLEPAPQRVRLGDPMTIEERQRIIGYGQDQSGDANSRRRRLALRVLAIGAYGSYPRNGPAAPNTFLVSEGPCHGDSGGPSFSEETGAVTGVYSLTLGASCTADDVRNVFTQVGPYEALIREALAFAGGEVLPEHPETGGGEGGTGGEDAGASGAGGEVEAGAGNSAGGAPGTGGSSTGEGGDGATGGSTPAAGGSGGSGANGGSGGGGGSTSGEAARAGAEVMTGEGSGSRDDGSCACRLEPAASKRALPWIGLLSLLAAFSIRRRRR